MMKKRNLVIGIPVTVVTDEPNGPVRSDAPPTRRLVDADLIGVVPRVGWGLDVRFHDGRIERVRSADVYERLTEEQKTRLLTLLDAREVLDDFERDHHLLGNLWMRRSGRQREINTRLRERLAAAQTVVRMVQH